MSIQKIGSLILVFLILSGALCSCSGNDSGKIAENASAAQSDPVGSVQEAEEGDDDTTNYFKNLEAKDYDGWTLNIANDELHPDWFIGFTAEELTGDEFNDSLYNRAIAIQDKFNVIVSEHHDGSVNGIKNCVMAGSGDVGFGYVIAASCMEMITGKFVKAVSEMPCIDMTRPYWDQGAKKTLTFFGKMYYGYCDISWDHYESMAIMYYNGFLLDDNGVEESPYELYKEGRWTLDAMYQMVSAIAKDLDGDGKMSVKKDLYGWAGRDFSFLPSLYSSGLRIIRYDEDAETFVMDITQEKVMAVGDMMNKIINDPSISSVGGNDDNRNLFKAGRSLFYSRLLGDFRHLRDKEDDYGIICFPPLEENTEVMVYVQNPYAILVPSDCPDDERIGTLIEALAAYTYDNILDIYINRSVIGKGLRDEQSAELLRAFIKVRAFDLCYAFNVKNPMEAYVIGVTTGNYASAQKRTEKIYQKNIKKAVEALRGKG
ncbi:MAG: extracellular solute-binding protein [Clostridia bacterium]|nr:extracellular solute-binding protein [Clostridia bacterium]